MYDHENLIRPIIPLGKNALGSTSASSPTSTGHGGSNQTTTADLPHQSNLLRHHMDTARVAQIAREVLGNYHVDFANRRPIDLS
jgi:hypothetical protein